MGASPLGPINRLSEVYCIMVRRYTEGVRAMLTMFRQDAREHEASRKDVREARDRALADLGLTFEQLADRASHGDFANPRERMTWLAFKHLGQV